MAKEDKVPQIPSTVWWGVRSLLQKSPKATIDERMLAASLSVQPAAARQYVSELKAVGIINDDGKPTELANRWRLDSTYQDAADEIIAKAYSESLVHLAPPGSTDRQVVINWFEHAGFGHGAARNKAATYFLLGSRTPNESPSRTSGGTRKAAEVGEGKSSPRTRQPVAQPRPAKQKNTLERASGREGNGAVPLNINIQIHIAADAGAEQIESIFSAMRRYLNESADT